LLPGQVPIYIVLAKRNPANFLRAGIVQGLNRKHGGIPPKLKRQSAGWQHDAAAKPKIVR